MHHDAHTLYLPGDIVLTQGRSWISRQIRTLTRTRGESKTLINHCGIITVAGGIHSCCVTEALTRVVEHSLYEEYGPPEKDKVMIVRPLWITDDQRAAIVGECRRYKGRKYGYLKIIAHAADYLVGGRYIFRRLAQLDDYPICSWLVAYAYDRAVNEQFCCDPGAAQPDDIYDCVMADQDNYGVVRPLLPLL